MRIEVNSKVQALHVWNPIFNLQHPEKRFLKSPFYFDFLFDLFYFDLLPSSTKSDK